MLPYVCHMVIQTLSIYSCLYQFWNKKKSESVITKDCKNQDNTAPSNYIRKAMHYKKYSQNLACIKIKWDTC